MTDKQLEKIETSLNYVLRDEIFIARDNDYEEGCIKAYNMCMNWLNENGISVKTDRSNENIIKIDEWRGGTRHHIFIHTTYLDKNDIMESEKFFRGKRIWGKVKSLYDDIKDVPLNKDEFDEIGIYLFEVSVVA